MRKETRCHHMGYSFWLTARVLLYEPSHRQDSTYNGLFYTSRGALAGMRNSSMCPLHEGSIRWPIAPWVNTLTTELHLAPRGRVSAHGVIGHQINPSWWTHWAISHSSQCSTTGVTKAFCMCYPVCGMVHIKEPLLLIEKSTPCSGRSGFP